MSHRSPPCCKISYQSIYSVNPRLLFVGTYDEVVQVYRVQAIDEWLNFVNGFISVCINNMVIQLVVLS